MSEVLEMYVIVVAVVGIPSLGYWLDCKFGNNTFREY